MGRDTSFFTTVKEQVDLEDYLAKQLGVELVPEGAGRMAAVCPFHEEDTPSFKVMDSDDGAWKRWWCFGGCQEGGTVIDAAMKAEGFDTAHEAARFLNDIYGLGLEIDSEAYKRFAKTVQETRDDIDRTRGEIANPESKAAKTAIAYLHNRGFSDETIEFFQLGVDTSRTRAGRLSIPLVDKANHPVSVANRALFDRFRCASCKEWVSAKEMVKLKHEHNKAVEKGEEDPPSWKRCPHCGVPDTQAKVSWLIGQNPKYLFVRDFDKANFLYNEHGTRQVLVRDETVNGLYLVEGYADVWSGWQSDHKAICSYNGAELSDWQAKEAVDLVLRPDKPVILVPDFDETGQSRIDKNIRKLRAVRADVEIQIIHGVDKLTYDDAGERRACKDLGDVLKHFGPEQVSEILEQNRWQAAEWQIRGVVEAKNNRTGEAFYSMDKQLQICAEILSTERSKVALDHLIPYLVESWGREEAIVRNWFYSNLSEENATSYQHLFKDIIQAREEARTFLQDDNVIPLGFAELDACLPGGGARPGQLAMALGKAQPLDAKILTPGGWRTMGELEPGDEVVDPEGGTAKIVAVHPQGEREIYRVTFSDGAVTECDGDHLWRVTSWGHGKWHVKTLNEIAPNGDFSSLQSSGRHIPVPCAVEFARDQLLPLDSYALGVLIGDGSLTKATPRFTNADPEIVEYMRDFATGLDLQLRSDGGVKYGYTLPSIGQFDGTRDAGSGRFNTKKNPLTASLTALGLQGHRAETKFVPEAYKVASAAERLEVLRGLMDTDGTVSVLSQPKRLASGKLKHYRSISCEFTSASDQLAADVAYLVRSLGGTAKIAVDKSGYRTATGVRKECLPRHRVRVSMPPELNPFRTPLKALLWDRKYPPRRYMISVDAIGPKEAKCISLDSDSQLYITDDFIVTHNSGTGKAQPLDAKVLTPGGWTTIGEIKVGDEVVNPEGGVANVVGVFPQGEREIYRVAVGDQGSTECDIEHLWMVQGHSGERKVKTLGEILTAADAGDPLPQVPALNPANVDRATGRLRNDRDPMVLWEREITAVEPAGRKQAQCIALDSDNQLYVTDDFIVTHNTMLASQILAHMADHGTRSIIFTLEQAAKSLFPRLVCQALDITPAEAEDLIKREDAEAEELLAPVKKLYENMLIIDNVPEEGTGDALRITPARIQAIIQEANMTHFDGEPAAVVIVDHLGILEVDDDAPREIRGSENLRPGFVMQRLFSVCKATSVFMLVLQQLPKEVEPGVAFGYDAGRGGSQQTDFCDFIFQIWRPEQRRDLDDEERAQYRGQYKLALGKNRYGRSAVAHLYFDTASLRIMPVDQVTQPDHQNEEGVIELPEESESSVKISSAAALEKAPRPGGDIGVSGQALDEAARESDTMPLDTQQLLDSLEGEDDVEQLGDPSLRTWFEE